MSLLEIENIGLKSMIPIFFLATLEGFRLVLFFWVEFLTRPSLQGCFPDSRPNILKLTCG